MLKQGADNLNNTIIWQKWVFQSSSELLEQLLKFI